MADWHSGLQIIDVADPAAPVLLASYDTPDGARNLSVVAGVAYVADWYSGLQIIDVSDPASPALLGFYDSPDSARDVAVVGDVAYVADGYSGLQIVDVSNPAAPALLGVYDTPHRANGVCVVGGVAYVADDSSGLQIIDVSIPTAPVLLGSYDTLLALDVRVVGDVAYMADYSSGLRVIDVSNPTAPSLLGSYNTPQFAYEVSVVGNAAYVADFGPGLLIIDVSGCPPCPADPTNLLASEPVKGVATLSWLDNANNEIGYRVRREQFLGGVWKNGAIVGTLPPDTATFAQSPGQGFWRYQVQAFTDGCDSAWTEFKPVPAAAPSGLAITKVNGVARLDWKDNTNFESKFLVQRQQKVANKWVNLVAVGNPLKNAVTFTNAPGAVTWRYRIRANSAGGNSAFTVWVPVTLP